MLRTKLLIVVVIALLKMTIFIPVTQARLVVADPENVISNSTFILTGEVISSSEAEEERTYTVLVDRVFKGDYSEAEIVFTAKKNPIYGWMGNIGTLPEVNTELLLFLRNDDNSNPYFSFDLNCMAVIEDQQVISLLGGSNITVNGEHWQIEDYIEAYNEFFNSVDPINTQIGEASNAGNEQNQDLPSRPQTISVSVFWPGIIAFLILLGLLLAGFWYYTRSKQHSLIFRIVGIFVCVIVAYIIVTFALTPLLL